MTFVQIGASVLH